LFSSSVISPGNLGFWPPPAASFFSPSWERHRASRLGDSSSAAALRWASHGTPPLAQPFSLAHECGARAGAATYPAGPFAIHDECRCVPRDRSEVPVFAHVEIKRPKTVGLCLFLSITGPHANQLHFQRARRVRTEASFFQIVPRPSGGPGPRNIAALGPTAFPIPPSRAKST